MSKKTCFVISPIGAKDSEVRKMADDLFDLIIEPALEKFDFDIIRADKISTSSSITTDIITLVQNSDLCIVDLTGTNANVMYECGRRHETGKPFIMVANEGEQLPFDVNTIRTFFYDTSNSRSIREMSKTIQEVVKLLISQGFSARSSGESLTTISDSLRRIERKLDDVVVEKHHEKYKLTNDQGETLEVLQSLTPVEAYTYAIKVNDLGLAAKIFPLIADSFQDIGLAFTWSVPIADRSEIAASIIEDNLIKIDPSQPGFVRGFRKLIQYWVSQNLKEKLDKAVELTNYVVNYVTNNEEKASVINQLQRMYYLAGDWENALKYAEEVISLWKEEASYWYNLALVSKKLDQLEKAENAINEMLRRDQADPNPYPDNLELAVQVYRANNKKEIAEELLNRLMTINKYKAEMLKE